MSIDSLISVVETKARELQEAIEALNAATQAEHGVNASWLDEHVQRVRAGLPRVRRDVAMAKRPKGPMVTLEWTGRGKEPVSAEVIRRTTTIAIVRVWSGEKRIRIKDGLLDGQLDRFLGSWRISTADIERIRAMPVGENDVSRALKAAEATR